MSARPILAKPGRLRRRSGVVAVVAALLMLTGCGSMPSLTVDDIPMPAPGGVGSGEIYTAEFDDVLNLPTKAKIKLYGNVIGQVDSVTVDNYRATVKMSVTKGTRLPSGTGATLRQSTPLGDVFLALNPPKQAADGMLMPGDRLNGKTDSAATVEDVMVTSSSLFNSGVFGSMRNVISELSQGLSGHDENVTEILQGFETAFTRLNQNTDQINNSLAQLEKLSGTLADGRQTVENAVTVLGPTLNTVSSQVDRLVELSKKLEPVLASTDDFLNTSSDDLIVMIDNVQRLVDALDAATPNLGTLADRVTKFQPIWANSTKGNSLAASLRVWYLTPGWGFDPGLKFPAPQDIPMIKDSLHQTLNRLWARLTGTQGAPR